VQIIKSQNINKKSKIDPLSFFTFKHELLKISVDLQTALAAEANLVEGQINIVTLRMF
jgi:hypothetical protein